MFERLDYILITDYENETSTLKKDSVEKRIDRLNEMRTSLSQNGLLIWEGNNFHVDCAMNKLFEEEEKGILSTVLLMWRLRLLYWLGVSADKLSCQYK